MIHWKCIGFHQEYFYQHVYIYDRSLTQMQHDLKFIKRRGVFGKMFKMFMLFAASSLLLSPARAGIWTGLARQTPNIAPNGNPSLMLLLSDGTVMVENDPTGGGGSNWFRLTPDLSGSYINGTWTQLATAHYGRAGCASDVLTNGQVFFAGGEYGSGDPTAEVYDPVSNVWNIAPVPTSLINSNKQSPIWGNGVTQCFGDAISELLPNGDVLVAPVAVSYAGETMLYNPVSNSFIAGPNLVGTNNSSQSEASWVKLPDQSILTINPNSESAERYIPSLNQWILDATVPVSLYSALDSPAAGELGAAFLLPNGQAIFLGGDQNTALYTPSGNINPGTWTIGPNFPMIGTNEQGCPDAPCAMMVNGMILCSTGNQGTFDSPISFCLYNYVSNSFTQINGPPGSTEAAGSTVTSFPAAPYYTKFLALPNGTVLWNYGDPQLYVYTPSGFPLAQGTPVVNSISQNADGSYLLTGVGLNGISEGAAYGDDAQMASNFPLVRMTNSATGHVYYGRTFNWSSVGVQTGNTVVTTDFTVPTNVPAGTYSLAAVANGFPSLPQAFTFPARPIISSVSISGANLILNATNVMANRNYVVLASTNLTSWTPVSTNLLGAAPSFGPFAITATNAVNLNRPASYYMLKAQ
jgi:hypothetical protein